MSPYICGETGTAEEGLADRRFTVGVVGEFKRGMSTVINALLEQELLPADVLPCTAVPVRVTYGVESRAELRMRDGSVHRIGVEELADYVTKLTSENESRAAGVDEAIVYCPCRICRSGVDIVDTPGLNCDEYTDRLCEKIIPELDAVIMVMVPGSPFSKSEEEFFCGKLMDLGWSRLIFLVNKIDTVRRANVRALVKEKIGQSVLEKTANLYGENSQQYKDAQMRLSNIRIFPISALDALDGKQSGDQVLVERSGIKPFEEALFRMIV